MGPQRDLDLQFLFAPGAGEVTGWQSDAEVLEALEGIVIRGATATDILAGKALME